MPTAFGGATSADAAGHLMDLVLGYQRTQVVHAAAALGLADHLAAEPRTVAQLAEATGTRPSALGRLVCALTGLGVVRDGTDGRIELTATGNLLRRDVPGSLLETVLAHGDDFYPVWRELHYSVATGEPAFARVHGLPNWDYRRQHPEANARFNAVMAASARSRAATLLASGRLPDQGVVVDVGGGNGTLLAAVLADHPDRRGVLLDQPHVVEGADEVLGAAGVADRCDIVAGDFFTSVPAGGDRYVLSGVLLDWADDRAGQILRCCREAVSAGSALLLIDAVKSEGSDPDPTQLLDLHMMVTNAGGRVRTATEWARLLGDNGFQLVDAPLDDHLFTVMEAVPATG